MQTQICVLLVCCAVASVWGQSSYPPEPTPSPDFQCPDLQNNYYPHPTNCSAYYHCTNGLAWYLECPASLYFNSKTKACDWPQNVDCTPGVTETPMLLGVTMISPAPEYKCEHNGAFPHETNCEYFYDCYNDVAWLGLCTEVMLFDLKYNGCNNAEAVDCGDRERPEGYPTPRPTTTQRPGTPFDCPELNGNFPDPDNCASFFVCTHGDSHHMTCQSPLVYNIDLELCDYQYNVDCNGRPIPWSRST